MQFAKTRIALAAGVALAAPLALANPSGVNRPIANYTSGTTDVYLAGSSAVDLALTRFFAEACDASTLDTYRSDAGVITYYLWTCESSTTNGFQLGSGNTKIAIHKNTNSSSDGTNLVADAAGATVKFLQVSDLASCTVAAVANTNSPFDTLSTCGTSAGTAGTGTQSAQVHFGFSDSEPAQFNAAVVSQLTTGYPFGIIFGIPVSKTLRDALQLQQFGVTGDDTEAKMPSLTASQVNAIFTGKATTWSVAAGVTGLGSSNQVYLVRRSDGSGTTRAFNRTFIGQFCVPGNTGTVAGQAITFPTSDCTVNSATLANRRKQASTSDDMASCVAQYDSLGLGAIGYLSTDYTPKVSDGYRFIKVDGYTPKLLNVIDGKWKDWSEESINYNTIRNAGGTGDTANFLTRFQTASKSASYLSGVVSQLTQSLGGWTGGIFGVPTNAVTNPLFGFAAAGYPNLTLPRTDASVLTTPVSPLSRIPLGPNLCADELPVSGYVAQ
jgi:hypothetical protein